MHFGLTLARRLSLAGKLFCSVCVQPVASSACRAFSTAASLLVPSSTSPRPLLTPHCPSAHSTAQVVYRYAAVEDTSQCTCETARERGQKEEDARCSDWSAAASSASMRSPLAVCVNGGCQRRHLCALRRGDNRTEQLLLVVQELLARLGRVLRVVRCREGNREHSRQRAFGSSRLGGRVKTHTRRWRQRGTPPGRTVDGSESEGQPDCLLSRGRPRPANARRHRDASAKTRAEGATHPAVDALGHVNVVASRPPRAVLARLRLDVMAWAGQMASHSLQAVDAACR